MAMRKDEIALSDLDFSLIKKLDNNSEFYLAYDRSMDELIFKLVHPKKITSVFHENNDIGFFVDMKNMMVVGIYFFNFEKNHLIKKEELKNLWIEYHLADTFSEFRKISKKNTSKHKKEKLATLKIIEQSRIEACDSIC